MSIAFYELAERIRRNDPIPRPLAALLCAVTPAVRVGMWWRRRQPVVTVDAHVISIGNLTAGGSGKTPLVIERARQELLQGRKVAILTRGYGSAATKEPIAAESGFSEPLYTLLGDEAALIARKVPGTIVIKCPDRVASARMALARYGCETLVLDDGFQYVRLARNEDVLVIDARNPFGNGCLIPRGVLREPVGALCRATHVVITRCDQARDVNAIVDRVTAIGGDMPIRLTRHAPTSCWRVSDGAAFPLDVLRAGPLRAMCAVGSPEAFFDTLASLGARVTERNAFADHTEIPAPALSGPLPIVVTEKDAVRMRNVPAHVFALAIELEDWRPV